MFILYPLCPMPSACHVSYFTYFSVCANKRTLGTFGPVQPFGSKWTLSPSCLLAPKALWACRLSPVSSHPAPTPPPVDDLSVELTSAISVMQSSLQKNSSLCFLISAFQISIWTENTESLQFLTECLHRSLRAPRFS